MKTSSAQRAPQLNLLDKLIRISLSASPPEYGTPLFFPALSTYQVERPFSLKEFRTALDYYLISNPMFQKYELQERVFDSPESFKLQDFQSVLVDEYLRYFDGFLLISVRYKSDPKRQGIFSCFPLQLIDGFKCFLFHQTLMKSLKAGRDAFRMKQVIEEHGLHDDDLEKYFPRPRSTINPEDDVRYIRLEMVESEGPALKVIPLLEDTARLVVASECKTLMVMKNASYGVADNLLFGNLLMYLILPEDRWAKSTGKEIKQRLEQEEAQIRSTLESLQEPEHFVQAGQMQFPTMMKHPERYIINNYGNCTLHTGHDMYPEKGLLVRYQWHMPSMVLSAFKGVRWTITLGDKAFNFRLGNTTTAAP